MKYIPQQRKAVRIEENGFEVVEPDEGKTLSAVEITTATPTPKIEEEKKITLESNGLHTITPDVNGEVMSKVLANVKIPEVRYSYGIVNHFGGIVNTEYPEGEQEKQYSWCSVPSRAKIIKVVDTDVVGNNSARNYHGVAFAIFALPFGEPMEYEPSVFSINKRHHDRGELIVSELCHFNNSYTFFQCYNAATIINGSTPIKVNPFFDRHHTYTWEAWDWDDDAFDYQTANNVVAPMLMAMPLMRQNNLIESEEPNVELPEID